MEIVAERIIELHSKIESIEGWLEPASGQALYQMAFQYMPLPNAAVVELGVWKGKSTAWLAAGLKDRNAKAKVYAIDTWEGSVEHKERLKAYEDGQLYKEFIENISRINVQDYVVPLKGTTVDQSRLWNYEIPIGLLHIDASHDYESVKQDFEHWSPLVMNGGFIVFDDVPSWPGPTRLVTELPRWYQQVAVSPNKWIVQKQS